MLIRRISGPADLERIATLTSRYLAEGLSFEETHALLRAAHAGCPILRPELGLVIEEDGEVVATAQGLELELQVGRARLKALGIQGLVVEPTRWGRGHVEALMEHGWRIARDLGFDLSIGFGIPRFYARWDAAPVIADSELWITVADVDDPGPTGFRPMGDGDLDPFLARYHQTNEDRVGVIVRRAEVWPWMFRKPAYYQVRADGYVGYDLRKDRDGLYIRDVGGVGPGFYRDVIRSLAGVALEHGLRRMHAQVPYDHPFAEAAIEPGFEVKVRYAKSAWCLARVLNVGSVLSKLRGELERRLRGSPWAERRVLLRLAAQAEAGEVTLNAPGADRPLELSLALPISAISQLVFGYRSAAALLDAAGLALDPERAALIAYLFPRGQPFVWPPDRF